MESNGKEGLVISVCPIGRYGNYFVTASGVGLKDTESHLKIYKFDPQNQEDPLRILSQVKVSVPFTAISWTRYGEELDDHRYGFIIGGHQDGSVSLWEATSIIQAKDTKKLNYGLLQSKKFHSSSVNVIRFNQKPSVFATASKDIVIISIEKNLTMESPMKCPSQDNSEIKSLSWNDKVSHILAAATTTGTTYIWEMKKTELFLTITDQGILNQDEEYRKDNINTKLLWCNDGVQIIIAYDHPEYTFLTQYHMKQPNAPSAEYYGGHREPICDLSKNPNDNNFILSLGKDDTVTCWSLRTQKPLVHIQLQEKSTSVVWLNKTPDIFIAASLEGNVTYHQVNFSSEFSNKAENYDAPPRWLAKKAGVSFAFGGKFATFNEKNNSNVTIHSLVGDGELTAKMKSFIENVEKADLSDLFEEKINSLSIIRDARDKNAVLFWVALKCIFTGDYQELFRYMGFDKTKLQNEVYTYIGKKVDKVQKKERQKITNININNEEAEKFWSEATGITKNEKDSEGGNMINKHNEVNNEKPMTIQETVTRNINWNQGTEKLIKQSLLIGDLESAVDVALKSGRDAEALLIASAGDKELFNKAKQSFFNKNKDLFIKNIFSSIINGNFDSLFDYNVLKDWKEYILYAKTYQQASEFLTFANNLGDRLANNPDIYMALVCYILGRNYEKCVDLLYNNYLKDTDKINKNEKKFYLQHLFEQVIAVKNVLQFNQTHDKTDKIISEYCELLINEGLFVEACTYLIKIRNNDNRNLILYDRLYNHCDSKLGNKFTRPQAPFNIVMVKAKVEKKVMEKVKSNAPSVKGKDLFDSGNLGTGGNVQSGVNKVFNQVGQAGQEKVQGTDFNKGISKPPLVSNVNLPKPQPFRNIPQVVNENITPPISQNISQNIPKHVPQNIPTTNPISTPQQAKNVAPLKPTMKPVNPPIPSFAKKPVVETPVEETPTFSNPQPVSRLPNTSGNVGTVNPPKPNFPSGSRPMSTTGPLHAKSEISQINPINPVNKLPSPMSTSSSQTPMNGDEEFVYNSFEKFITLYNNAYPDENKQKDFFIRVSALLTKLKNHEIKVNLSKLLVDFISLYESEASPADLKKMQLKIQSNGWDQNKLWMSCIEKIVNMPKK